MEELTEVITAAEFHPKECNLFVYSSSKGMLRLCDMRQSALCDSHAKSIIIEFLAYLESNLKDYVFQFSKKKKILLLKTFSLK